MDNLEEILLDSERKLLVADAYPLFSSDNTIFVMFVKEERGAAGGRAAGYGSRRISQVIGFRIKEGVQEKFFDAVDPSVVSLFEIPYSATAMDIVLHDGRKVVISGVVDHELVQSYISNTRRAKQ